MMNYVLTDTTTLDRTTPATQMKLSVHPLSTEHDKAVPDKRRLPNGRSESVLPAHDHMRHERVILLAMGTRPDIIKMAPVYHALKNSPLHPLVLHTGQHEEMAWPLFEFFGIKPEISLDLRRERESLGYLTSVLADHLDRFMSGADVDAVLVHGDTSTALVTALTAFYQQIPVGHVEAGLRSHLAYDPFPEEKNRQLIARIARWHFAPTHGAVRNLVAEGISPGSVHCVGNTIVDATLWGMRHVASYFHGQGMREDCVVCDLVDRFHVDSNRLIVVTAHRRENWHQRIREVARTVRQVVETYDNVLFVWPVHPNKVVRDDVYSEMSLLDPHLASRVILSGPINYPQMLWLLKHAWLIMTDSGGVQEEAAAVRKPVLVLRNATERPELIDAGGGALVGTDRETIRAWISKLWEDESTYERMTEVENPFGDGRAAMHIADILYHELIAFEPTAAERAAA